MLIKMKIRNEKGCQGHLSLVCIRNYFMFCFYICISDILFPPPQNLQNIYLEEVGTLRNELLSDKRIFLCGCKKDRITTKFTLNIQYNERTLFSIYSRAAMSSQVLPQHQHHHHHGHGGHGSSHGRKRHGKMSRSQTLDRSSQVRTPRIQDTQR